MYPKERILSALRGQPVDRIPWCPFLAYFFESQPPEIRKMGELAFMQSLGADPLLRGSHTLFTKHYKTVTIRERTRGITKTIEYETPVGSLCETHTYTAQGDTWFLTEHPVKTEEDFKILSYLNEDMIIEPNFFDFDRDYDQIGKNALLMPLIGTELKTSFQSLVEHWVGTENLVYALYDYPDVVKTCLKTMQTNATKTVEISALSRAEALLFFEDTSTTNISPTLFREFIAPEISHWAHMLHKHEKLLVHHACGHVRNVLTDMARTGIDCIESLSPPPTGDIEIIDAFAQLPENICIIGGIEPTFLLNSNMTELEAYTRDLLKKIRGKRYILANSDSCPPGVSYEKLRLITSIVQT